LKNLNNLILWKALEIPVLKLHSSLGNLTYSDIQCPWAMKITKRSRRRCLVVLCHCCLDWFWLRQAISQLRRLSSLNTKLQLAVSTLTLKKLELLNMKKAEWRYFTSSGKVTSWIWHRSSLSHISILNLWEVKTIGTCHQVRYSTKNTTKRGTALQKILVQLKKIKNCLVTGMDWGYIVQISLKVTHSILKMIKALWNHKNLFFMFRDAPINLIVNLQQI